MTKTRFITLALTASILSTSCIGSYSAFNGLKEWNKDITDSKFVNNLVFWGLWIVPVYEIFFLGDTVIFNVVEFWSGSNPIAMNAGDTETQTIVKNGNTYEMVATKNQMDITVIEGKDKGKSIELFYLPEEKSWNAKTPEGKTVKLSAMKDGFYFVYLPNGEKVKMDVNTTRNEGIAILQAQLLDHNAAYTLSN